MRRDDTIRQASTDSGSVLDISPAVYHNAGTRQLQPFAAFDDMPRPIWQTARPSARNPGVNHLQIVIVAIGALALVAVYLRHRGLRRERSLRHLLDRADALEQVLHRTRDRMNAMRQVVDRVPSDIAAQAHASLDAQSQVQQGLRDVLEHRLWISKHGLTAPQKELDTACRAMDRAYANISDQLGRLESAGAELADVTQAAIEQASREPATLTRRNDE